MWIQAWEEWRTSKYGKTLLGRKGSYRVELTCVLYPGSCWGPLLVSGVLSALKAKWYPPTRVQIEKDLIDLVWFFWRDNEDALRLSLSCNFAAWQIHMWGSTAEAEVSQLAGKMLEALLPCSCPHVCWRKTCFWVLWLEPTVLVAILSSSFRNWRLLHQSGWDVYCANHAYCCQILQSSRVLTIICWWQNWSFSVAALTWLWINQAYVRTKQNSYLNILILLFLASWHRKCLELDCLGQNIDSTSSLEGHI